MQDDGDGGCRSCRTGMQTAAIVPWLSADQAAGAAAAAADLEQSSIQ